MNPLQVDAFCYACALYGVEPDAFSKTAGLRDSLSRRIGKVRSHVDDRIYSTLTGGARRQPILPPAPPSHFNPLSTYPGATPLPPPPSAHFQPVKANYVLDVPKAAPSLEAPSAFAPVSNYPGALPVQPAEYAPRTFNPVRPRPARRDAELLNTNRVWGPAPISTRTQEGSVARPVTFA